MKTTMHAIAVGMAGPWFIERQIANEALTFLIDDFR